MPFEEVFAVNSMSSLFNAWSLAVVVFALLERKLPVRRVILPSVLFAFIRGLTISAVTFHDIRTIHYITRPSYTAVVFISLFCCMGFLFYTVADTEKKQLFLLYSIAAAFIDSVDLMVSDLLYRIPSILELENILVYLLTNTVALLVILFLFKVCIRFRIFYYFRQLLRYPALCVSFCSSYLLFSIVFYWIVADLRDGEDLVMTWLFAFGLGYLILLLVTAALIREFHNRKALRESKALILQQQSYMQRLEHIQRELRSVQHDYKNMLAGLYAQAHEGNTDKVKEYLAGKLLQLDGEVQQDIKRMNQLTQIGVIELKALILMKMIEAEKVGVAFMLEVINPVHHVEMVTEDLLRCLGILLDNALDETGKMEEGAVTLVMLMEQEKLTVAVKNPCLKQPQLSRIWEDGYSTKGQGRGIGLTNYRRLLHRYDNVSHETRLEENCLTQVFTILNHVRNVKKDA